MLYVVCMYESIGMYVCMYVMYIMYARMYFIFNLSFTFIAANAFELEYLHNSLRSWNCLPISLDPKLAYAAYQGHCKEVLWPTFHNVDLMDQIHADWLMNEVDGVPRANGDDKGSNDNDDILSWDKVCINALYVV